MVGTQVAGNPAFGSFTGNTGNSAINNCFGNRGYNASHMGDGKGLSAGAGGNWTCIDFYFGLRAVGIVVAPFPIPDKMPVVARRNCPDAPGQKC